MVFNCQLSIKIGGKKVNNDNNDNNNNNNKKKKKKKKKKKQLLLSRVRCRCAPGRSDERIVATVSSSSSSSSSSSFSAYSSSTFSTSSRTAKKKKKKKKKSRSCKFTDCKSFISLQLHRTRIVWFDPPFRRIKMLGSPVGGLADGWPIDSRGDEIKESINSKKILIQERKEEEEQSLAIHGHPSVGGSRQNASASAHPPPSATATTADTTHTLTHTHSLSLSLSLTHTHRVTHSWMFQLEEIMRDVLAGRIRSLAMDTPAWWMCNNRWNIHTRLNLTSIHWLSIHYETNAEELVSAQTVSWLIARPSLRVNFRC